MFAYDRKLQYPVRIQTPDPRMAAAIISQYGGPDGELGASLRYLSQRFTMPHREVAGLLTDIGVEELGHLEIVGALVHQLTRNLSPDQVKDGGFEAYYADHTLSVFPQAAGGTPFTASAIGVKGDPITELHEDLAAEQKARTTYENLLRLADDPDVKDVLRFLRQREIVHYQRFAEALEMVKSRLDSRNYYTCNLALPYDCACRMPCNRQGEGNCGCCNNQSTYSTDSEQNGRSRCCNNQATRSTDSEQNGRSRCCNGQSTYSTDSEQNGRSGCCNNQATRSTESEQNGRSRCCNNQATRSTESEQNGRSGCCNNQATRSTESEQNGRSRCCNGQSTRSTDSEQNGRSRCCNGQSTYSTDSEQNGRSGCCNNQSTRSTGSEQNGRCCQEQSSCCNREGITVRAAEPTASQGCCHSAQSTLGVLID